MTEVMEAALREQRIELDQGSAFLGTVGNNAPFLGLLGTVLGVVKAFQELSTTSGSAMGSVLSGIAEALIATALGSLWRCLPSWPITCSRSVPTRPRTTFAP